MVAYEIVFVLQLADSIYNTSKLFFFGYQLVCTQVSPILSNVVATSGFTVLICKSLLYVDLDMYQDA